MLEINRTKFYEEVRKMFEKDNSSEIETLLIPALEMREAAGRLKKILGINAELNFDPRTGQKLGNAWEQLEALIGLLEDVMNP
ncbi:hypothetical protein COU95_00890 [Candidatus Shapirobacteria bacterium CG10_big_fil_rev_8_21_14_0_10_40_9]|uniref:Uncharacterized protein n=1 Tax=Candidatus Shapirobacteria bacterium CG10_big_fil_rev_8_21_14_0_10_40_9 TaxID=1974888 RepID=A0A2M8L465_9BACT|nr:MAG: hypothetical protein COU95_00890 [Candidatus Shapirobacteria bacterium CG10_big_fil_rev_8_21_14_0_10_40_9]